MIVLVGRIVLGQQFFPITDNPTVQVSGSAFVTAEPDRALLRMSVTEIAVTVTAAKETVDRQVKRVQEMLVEHGVRRNDINTSIIRVNRMHDRPERGSMDKQLNERFRVSREIRVTVENLKNLERILDRSTRLGVNEIWNVSLYSSREDSLRHQAMEMAAKDARERAGALTQTMGRTLGALFMAGHNFGGGGGPVYPLMAEARGAGGGDFYTGTIEISARVNAVFLMGE